jgi:superfamily II DNA or RNA helicase
LRWYQAEACQAAIDGFEEFDRQLLVMCTGAGKTQCFGAIARQWTGGSGRVLVLAHRAELVEQARARIEQMTGELVDVEQADRRASRSARIVVASVDTIKQKARLERFGQDHFGLIIFDEAHHAVAKTYMRPLEFFQAKLLGVTATPDRGDERALGKLFQNVPYCFDISQGIEQGYLVPLRGQQVELGEIQLDGVQSVAGDLVKGQLDEVMLKAVEGIVKKTLELAPGRSAVCFFPGVNSAQYATERFNALVPHSAGFISGESAPLERARIIAEFREGRLRYLCNCMVATEGTDLPNASCIVQARPTKSRSLYAQMVGRGGRVLGGLVEAIPGKEGAAERRALIAGSVKPDCLILDFVGNATKHALVTPEDLLGGDYSEEEVALAKKKAKTAPGSNPQQLLEDSRKELQRVAAAIQSRVLAQARAFDPFAVLDIDITSTTREDMRWGRQPPTEKMLEQLKKMKLPASTLANISQREAKKILAERNRRHDAGLATLAQLGHLRKFGLADNNITFAGAGRALTYVAQNGWSAAKVDLARLTALAKGT